MFTEFDAWVGLEGHGRSAARAAVARGQALFNTLAIPIRHVSGINDDFGVAVVIGTCTTCHDTPHAGDHSVPAPLDIGVAAPPVSIAEGGDGVHNSFGLPVGDAADVARVAVAWEGERAQGKKKLKSLGMAVEEPKPPEGVAPGEWVDPDAHLVLGTIAGAKLADLVLTPQVASAEVRSVEKAKK